MEASWRPLGPSLGSQKGPGSSQNRTPWEPFGYPLGTLWELLGMAWALLRRFWELPGRSWEPKEVPGGLQEVSKRPP